MAARVADLLVGPDGAPVEAAILTRSHATPPVIRPDLLSQVEAVTPSTDGQLVYRPCRVTLGDGRVVDRVYVQEAWTWKAMWGSWPEDYRERAAISIDDVVGIEESPSRIAPDLANRLLEAGETAMGGTRFTLVLRDGRRVNVSTGNAVDFPGCPTAWPPATSSTSSRTSTPGRRTRRWPIQRTGGASTPSPPERRQARTGARLR